jgi:hypothetical protein
MWDCEEVLKNSFSFSAVKQHTPTSIGILITVQEKSMKHIISLLLILMHIMETKKWSGSMAGTMENVTKNKRFTSSIVTLRIPLKISYRKQYHTLKIRMVLFTYIGGKFKRKM